MSIKDRIIKYALWLFLPLAILVFLHNLRYTFIVYQSLFTQVPFIVWILVVLTSFELFLFFVVLAFIPMSYLFNREYISKNILFSLGLLSVSYLATSLAFPFWVGIMTIIFWNIFHFLHLI